MKIIVLLNSLYTGGAEYSTLIFYGWLSRQEGFDVKLVCYKKANPSYSHEEFGFKEFTILEGPSFFKRLGAFNKIVREFHPDVVHSVLFQANIIGRFSRFLTSFVHVESLVNEMYSDHRLSDPQVTRLKLECYRLFDFLTQLWGVDHFHANGKSVALHYQKKLHINPRRVTVIPRGRAINPFVANVSIRQKIRDELRTGNRLLMMNVARHEYQKGHDLLLEAFEKIKSSINVQLVIVGREGKLTGRLVEFIKHFGLEEHVLLLGHRNDISELLIAADIFVFPSRFEGLPGALIEAEAAGLPIVCSDIANNREVAVEGRNAFFFESGNTLHLAETLLAATSYNNLAAMRDESKAIFSEKFSLLSVHENMLEFLKGFTKK